MFLILNPWQHTRGINCLRYTGCSGTRSSSVRKRLPHHHLWNFPFPALKLCPPVRLHPLLVVSLGPRTPGTPWEWIQVCGCASGSELRVLEVPPRTSVTWRFSHYQGVRWAWTVLMDTFGSGFWLPGTRLLWRRDGLCKPRFPEPLPITTPRSSRYLCPQTLDPVCGWLSLRIHPWTELLLATHTGLHSCVNKSQLHTAVAAPGV